MLKISVTHGLALPLLLVYHREAHARVLARVHIQGSAHMGMFPGRLRIMKLNMTPTPTSSRTGAHVGVYSHNQIRPNNKSKQTTSHKTTQVLKTKLSKRSQTHTFTHKHIHL